MVKKKNKRFKSSRNTRFEKEKNPGHERFMLVLFFALVLMTVFIFFNDVKMPLTGQIVDNGVSLDKNSYKNGESLEGTASLTVEQQDVLPNASLMTFSILSDGSKCPVQYVCQDADKTVPWYSETAGACEMTEEDPAGECCRLAKEKCSQVMWNKDFNASIGVAGRWIKTSAAHLEDSVGIQKVVVGETENEIVYGKTGYMDSYLFKSTIKNASLTLKQDLIGTRTVKVIDFKERQFIPVNCHDSDGLDIHTKGTCVDSSSHTDSCYNSTYITEYVCFSDACAAVLQACPTTETCSDGKCGMPVQNQTPQCSDSDGGYNPSVIGSCTNTTSATSLFDINWSDQCVTITQNGINVIQLKEYRCDNYNCVSNYTVCPTGTTCSSGRCTPDSGIWGYGISPPGTNTTTGTGTGSVIGPSCSDTDNEIKTIKGTCTQSGAGGTNVLVFNDHCIVTTTTPPTTTLAIAPTSSGTTIPSGSTNPSRLVEYYCNATDHLCHSYVYTCPGTAVCSDGRCVYPSTIIPPEQASAPVTMSETLQWRVAWQRTGDYPCAFEVIVRGTNASGASRNLHYYYKVDLIDGYCNHPNANTTDKYFDLAAPDESSESDSMVWDLQSRGIYGEWTLDPLWGNETDTLVGVQLISYVRKASNDAVYAQKVWFDYFILAKPGWDDEAINCTAYGKKCCLAGTGFGNYYGEQLNCSDNHECWESCTDSTSLTFKNFISKSDSSSKSNKTEETCQAVVDGVVVDLIDYCIEGEAGKGYTACTGNTGSCKNWETPNVYNVPVSSSTGGINLKAPGKNGTYSLVWKYSYLPIAYMENGVDPMNCGDNEDESCSITIFEKVAQFTVGTVSSCEPNWVYLNNWSACENNSQWRTKEDTNHCLQNAPTYKIDETQSCGNGCMPDVYQCSGSIYQQCSADGTVWNSLADCAAQGQSCDVNQGCYGSCTPYCEGVPCNGDDSCGGVCTNSCKEEKPIFGQWYFWVLIVLILVVVFVILILKIFKKKPNSNKIKKNEGSMSASGSSQGFGSSQGGVSQEPNPEYAEVASYIKEAMSAGATKQDVKAKLMEAGWPEDAINEAFKSSGY